MFATLAKINIPLSTLYPAATLMNNAFFERPILNSPYEYPNQHWELDPTGLPTQKIILGRRPSAIITPIPKPKKIQTRQSTADDADDTQPNTATHTIVNALRAEIDLWRAHPLQHDWCVTAETARLLQHWRRHTFSGIRPFFCQIEAVETVIWLTEVAPQLGARGKQILDHLAKVNQDANPELIRLALKLATGAGKTTVMAMLIAWQTINAVRRPNSKKFSRGFLIVAPGLTIKDRLRVLQPSDPNNYYRNNELVPGDLLPEMGKAKVVITNYHAFKLRERTELSKGGRLLLQGRGGEALNTLESEGQMLQRVMPELMGMKNILVINDEAHHCYREKPTPENEKLRGDEKKEAEDNNEAARLWISGLEVVKRKLGLAQVIDLSATPFFLSGSGYAEGTLFPWIMSDFSLMDAIECGIVKLPRVPVTDNTQGTVTPKFRDLWPYIGHKLSKKGRNKTAGLDPLALPAELQQALETLYSHYAKTFDGWQKSGIRVPPCFIIVCNNTATSKLVYDYIAGFQRQNTESSTILENGRLALFRNFDEQGNPLARPNTLLIDSEQLESGEALNESFRSMAADEIGLFRREIIQRSGNPCAADNLTDQDLLREVMNTVGKEGKLGGQIRCVVSVSMLTEGWDANNVTHILGVRAFGTQLLCEQVIGRALRRWSYTLNDENRFNVEYADIFGIPFDFTAQAVIAPPQPPPSSTHIKAMLPERDALEIRFPRVQGYRVELPQERLSACFNDDSRLILTPEQVGAPSTTRVEGIIGEGIDLRPDHLDQLRPATLLMHLTRRLLYTHWRDSNDAPKLHLFGQLKAITKQWLETCLECQGGTRPAQLMYLELADLACERITAGILRAEQHQRPIHATLDAYNPQGSSSHVNFHTLKTRLWHNDARKSQLNFTVLDSDWEAEFCRVAEAHPKVIAYIKNHGLGFEVPYRLGAETRSYLPDFIVRVDDGHGDDDLLNLVVEIKGYRGEDAKEKKTTMESYWIPGVNRLQTHGRWAFAEFTEVYRIEEQFAQTIHNALQHRENQGTAP